jgi:hypothetical protein
VRKQQDIGAQLARQLAVAIAQGGLHELGILADEAVRVEAYWRRPEAYLDENVRRGISMWSSVGQAPN